MLERYFFHSFRSVRIPWDPSFYVFRWMLATWAHLDMEELVYHLKAPLEGTSKDVLWSYVWSCGMISFAVLAILIALFIILRHRKKVEIILGCICIALGIALSSYSLYNVWTTLDIDTYLHIQNSYSTLIEDNYVNPSQTTITFPEKKRNLIYIYLESMESTYSDKKTAVLTTTILFPP